jgi:putative toxin-antitoxin system toxin component, PIN family
VRLVLDTNTVVSALLWRGTPHQLIAAARERPVAFFTSPALLAELEEVLARGKLASAATASGLTPTRLMQRYRCLATVIQPVPIPPTILADPDDDHVLACALAAQAHAIVSGDSDLLALGAYQDIPIITAAQCLMRIKL